MKKVETLRQLQQVTVYIYKDLQEACKRHNVNVYLIAGTLLGAIRHGGCIPWDDDVDVCMSRPDYNRLLALTEGKISEKCRIIDPATNTDFKGCIPLVVYENSVLHSCQFKGNEKLKISISIFVYDGIPENKITRYLYFKRMYMLRAEHALCRANFKNVNTKAARLVGPILSPLYREKSVWKYKKKILKLQQKYAYEEHELVCTNVDSGSDREVLTKASFEIPVSVSFEGMSCDTFSSYREYLSQYYGDYMTPPPEGARIPKHGVEAEIEDDFVFEESSERKKTV